MKQVISSYDIRKSGRKWKPNPRHSPVLSCEYITLNSRYKELFHQKLNFLKRSEKTGGSVLLAEKQVSCRQKIYGITGLRKCH